MGLDFESPHCRPPPQPPPQAPGGGGGLAALAGESGQLTGRTVVIPWPWRESTSPVEPGREGLTSCPLRSPKVTAGLPRTEPQLQPRGGDTKAGQRLACEAAGRARPLHPPGVCRPEQSDPDSSSGPLCQDLTVPRTGMEVTGQGRDPTWGRRVATRPRLWPPGPGTAGLGPGAGSGSGQGPAFLAAQRPPSLLVGLGIGRVEERVGYLGRWGVVAPWLCPGEGTPEGAGAASVTSGARGAL